LGGRGSCRAARDGQPEIIDSTADVAQRLLRPPIDADEIVECEKLMDRYLKLAGYFQAAGKVHP